MKVNENERNKNKLICGWGINDVDYTVHRCETSEGKSKSIWICPYYRKWKEIIRRCFDPKEHKRYPNYTGCTICEEWRYLSNFIKWVDSQPNRDWENCHPDKDLLMMGNKHYSAITVVFIPAKVNIFLISSGKARGECMLGVSLSGINKNPYKAQCRNPFNRGDRGVIGCFPTELEAHKAWQAKKHEYALQLAGMQEDERVVKALRERYAPDKDWTDK